MYYMRYHERYDCTTEEFIAIARAEYGWHVPTFRQALKDLFRSLVRTWIINRAIPDLRAAINHLESNEYCFVPTDDKPNYWEFERLTK